MPQGITTITLALPYRLGTVNCYLVEADSGFVLIDTGGANMRDQLDEELAGAGCQPGSLRLIALTHGDFDHTGNCAYLRAKFDAPVGMHRDDAGMAERGDMFWNRESSNVLVRMIAPPLFGFARSSRFEPDLYLEDGADLTEYGLDAQVLSIPGHSKGSVGILTAGGDLFCGDLLENRDGPALNSIMDDPLTAGESVDRLRRLEIDTVYPGHGEPFPLDLLPGNL